MFPISWSEANVEPIPETARGRRCSRWPVATAALVLGAALAWPGPAAAAAAELVINVVGLRPPAADLAVTLVAPDGGTETARDDDGDGTVVITPIAGPGEYRVTIRVDGRSESLSVTVPRSGLVTVTFAPDAGDEQVTITYDRTQGFGGEEIMVTARKREEDVQTIPIAITAISEATMAAQSMRNLSDVDFLVPNVIFDEGGPDEGGSSDAIVFIRGIGQNDPAPFADPGVGIYVDGVYLPRAQGGVLDLLDLERVEILRGPQGTLFGKNTTAGAIQLVTRKPRPGRTGRIDLTIGRFHRQDANIVVNAPLSERLLSSVALSSTNHDGYSRYLTTGERLASDHRETARVALRWLAAANVVVDWTADAMRERDKPAVVLLVGRRADPLTELYNQVLADSGQQPVTDEFLTPDLRSSYGTDLARNDGDVRGTTLTVNWNLDAVNLKSITAYRYNRYFKSNDHDGTPVMMAYLPATAEQDQVSEELELTGAWFNGRLTWLAGALYFSESTIDNHSWTLLGGLYEGLEAAPGPIYSPPGYPATLCNPGPPPPGFPCFGGAGNPANLALVMDLTAVDDIRATSRAVFGEATLAVTDRFSATAGLRYTHEEKSIASNQLHPYGIPDVYVENEADWEAWSPRLSMAFQATENTLLYATIARGFKSGGFNARSPAGILHPYSPEYVQMVESGFKTEWSQKRWRLNGALFYNDYTDIQFTAVIVVDGQPVPVVANAGRGTASGVELELNGRPARGWTLSASLGYIDTEYRELQDVVYDVTLSGKYPKAPKWTFHLSPQYSFPIRDAGHLIIRGDYSYRSDFYHDIANTPELLQEGYGLVHARLTFARASGRWEVALFGKNLTDEVYLEGGHYPAGFSTIVAHAGRPREWGISLRLRVR